MLSRPAPFFLTLALASMHAGTALADEPPPLQVAGPAVPAPVPPAAAAEAPTVAVPAPENPAVPAPALSGRVLPTVTAPAQVAAAPEVHKVDTVISTADGGAVYVPGRVPGGFGRLTVRVESHDDVPTAAMFSGIQGGIEVWGDHGAVGGGLPVTFFGGVWSPVVFTEVHAGINAFTVDTVAHHTGFGLFSPRVGARLGVHLGAIYLALDADVQRRWMWSLDDLTLLGAGLSIGTQTFGK